MWKQFVRLTVIVALLLAFLPAFVQPRIASAAPPPASRFVMPGGALFGSCDATKPCGSIAYALSVANAGETISVEPGTYFESGIVIDKDIYIVGAGRGQTIIDAGGVDRHFNIVAGASSTWLQSLMLINGSSAAEGGAIRLQSGELTVYSVQLIDNYALGGGAISHESNDRLWLLKSDLYQNHATGPGGALYCNNCGAIESDGSVFQDNLSGGDGGAIFMSNTPANPSNSRISNTRFTNNSADNGGAIYNLQRDLTVRFSGVNENEADNGNGGAIFSDSANLRVVRTALIGNSALDNGGGIYFSNGELRMLNNTISGNSAILGGGVTTLAGTALRIHNNTFYGNSGTFGGGAISSASSPFVLDHSILTASIGAECNLFGIAPVGSNNLIDDASCDGPALTNLGPVTNLDPNLAHNGWSFRSHMPLAGSNAIDAGAGCFGPNGNSLPRDQRGVPRPQGAACDIGAIEVQ